MTDWREQRVGDGWEITVIPRRDAPLLMWLVVASFDAFVLYGVTHENPNRPSPAFLYWAFVVGAVLLTCIAVSNSWGRTVLRVDPRRLRKVNLPLWLGSFSRPLFTVQTFVPEWHESPPQARPAMAWGAVHAMSFTGERQTVARFEQLKDVERAVERLNAMLGELRPQEKADPYR